MYKKIIINNIITNYSVSDEGLIKNDLTGYILKVDPRGTVQIRVDGISKVYTVGRLVAKAFLPNAGEGTLVWHIDRDVLNNKVENLKWITNAENTQYTWEKRRKNGTTNAGVARSASKKRENIVDLKSLEMNLKDDEKQVIIDGQLTYYGISKDGKLRNLITDKILQGTILNTYRSFNLHIGGHQQNIAGHRLVALMFLDNPTNKPYVDHINGNRLDNRVENLRWSTAQENSNNIHQQAEYSIKGNQNYSLSAKDQPNESWRSYRSTNIYISNLGRIKNSDTNKIIKGSIRTDGYHQAKLSIDKGQSPLTHRRVWETFNGPVPENMVINHINGVKSDNRLENLELVSQIENMQKASQANAWHFQKVGEFNDKNELLRTFDNASVAARDINILPGSMRNSIRRNGKCYNGLSYRYLNT